MSDDAPKIEGGGVIGQLTSFIVWAVKMIADLASGRKTEEQARAEAQAKGITISETATDAELKAHEAHD
jgi:L-aminopeptidase/D-esterase-like protein